MDTKSLHGLRKESVQLMAAKSTRWHRGSHKPVEVPKVFLEVWLYVYDFHIVFARHTELATARDKSWVWWVVWPSHSHSCKKQLEAHIPAASQGRGCPHSSTQRRCLPLRNRSEIQAAKHCSLWLSSGNQRSMSSTSAAPSWHQRG